MKKLISLTLTLVCIFCLSSCSGNVTGVKIIDCDSEIYSDSEIESAIYVTLDYFRKEFDGCNLTEMDEEALQVLTNKMLIDINQDEKCAQCSNIPITNIEDLHGISLVRALSNGDLAIGLFNTLDVSLTASITLNDCGLNFASGQTLELTNCWTGEKEIVKNGIIQKRLDAYDSVVYRAKIVKA